MTICPEQIIFKINVHVQLNISKALIEFARQLDEITAQVYAVLSSTLCPAVNHPSVVPSLPLLTLMQVEVCVQTQTCERKGWACVLDAAYHSRGRCHFLLKRSQWWISFETWRRKSSLLDNEATENKYHGEIIGNDLSLENGLQLKLTFKIDYIEPTRTRALRWLQLDTLKIQ